MGIPIIHARFRNSREHFFGPGTIAMYGGMNRNELTGLTALIVLVALGIGVHTYRSYRQGGGIWVEVPSPGADSTALPRAGGLRSVAPAGAAANGRGGIGANRTALSSASQTGETAGRLDLNLAGQADLEALPMIGPERARAVLKYRAQKGKFQHLDEVRQLLRFGEGTWRQIEPLVCIGKDPFPATANSSPTTLTSSLIREASSAPAPDASSARAAAAPSPTALPGPLPLIDINTASAEELATLWNVGPTKSEKIVRWRLEHGPFKKPEDLMLVPGIGPATLRRNLHRIRVTPARGQP